MSIEVRGVNFHGRDRLLFRCDEPVTEERLDLIRRRGISMIELRSAATGGRDPGRLRFLADIPGLVSVYLFDSDAANWLSRYSRRWSHLGCWSSASFGGRPPRAPDQYTGSAGEWTRTEYDRYGQPATVTNSTGASTTFEYNQTVEPRGLVTKQSDSVTGDITLDLGPGRTARVPVST